MNKKKAAPTEKKENKFYKDNYGNVWGQMVPTPPGRLCYPSLITPKKFESNNNNQTGPNIPKYETQILLEKNHPRVMLWLTEMEPVIDEMLEDYNRGQQAKISLGSVLRDGDETDTEKYPFYVDRWILTARNKDRPNLYSVERDDTGNLKPVEPSKFEGGILVKAAVTPLITAKGVSFKLHDLLWGKDDGVRFGGAFVKGVDLLSTATDSDFLDDAPTAGDISLEKAAADIL